MGRSQNLTGPYLDAQGRDLRSGGGDMILARNDTFVGPGHISIISDDAGVDWLLYHAIPLAEPLLSNGVNHRPALLDRIEWADGWPVVNQDQGPSSTPQPAPTISKP